MNEHIKKLYYMQYEWNKLCFYNDRVKKYFIDTLIRDKIGKPKKMSKGVKRLYRIHSYGGFKDYSNNVKNFLLNFLYKEYLRGR